MTPRSPAGESAGKGRNGSEKLLRLRRLGDVILKSLHERARAIGHRGVGRERHGWNTPALFRREGSNTADQLVAGRLRHADITDDDVWNSFGKAIQSLVDRACQCHVRFTPGENGFEQLARIGLILAYEHAKPLEFRWALQQRVRVTVPRHRFHGRGQRCGSKRRNRQPHDERRALSYTITARFDAAAVQLDEMLYDCKAEPEPPVRARGGSVLLPEWLEDVRKERRRDAGSCSATTISTCESSRCIRT